MIVKLTDKMESVLKEGFPCLVYAEEAISDILGITLEQIRGSSRTPSLFYARLMFWDMCIKHVKQYAYLSSYMNRCRSVSYYYEKNYDSTYKNDVVFRSMYTQVRKAFDKKMNENGHI